MEEIQIFGELSTLCQPSPTQMTTHSGVDTLLAEPIYVAMAVVLTLLYLMWLPTIIKRRGVKWSSIRRQIAMKEEHASSGSMGRGFGAITWLLSIGLLVLFSIRGLAQFIDSSIKIEWVSYIPIIILSIIAVMLYGWSVIKIGGYLTMQREFSEHILLFRQQLLFFAIMLLCPLYTICCLASFDQAKLGIQLSIAVVFIFVLIYIRHSFLLFMRQNFSILHWILYLCGVEILPLTLVWAMAVRGFEAGTLLGV